QLAMESLGQLNLMSLLGRLASKSPTPGGGAVAGLVGAQSAALARMVVSYSLGRKSLAEHQSQLETIATQLDNARGVMLSLADADADAYASLSALWGSKSEKPDEFRAAVRRAIQVPRSVMAASADLLRLCESLAPISNPNLASDLVAAAVLAEAAAKAASLNAHVNAEQLDGVDERDRLLSEVDTAIADAAERRARVASASGR
ncbi:MAG: cyclodeaminase/cyclohydrolase family protein, partial [Planctomycetota bacterium]